MPISPISISDLSPESSATGEQARAVLSVGWHLAQACSSATAHPPVCAGEGVGVNESVWVRRLAPEQPLDIGVGGQLRDAVPRHPERRLRIQSTVGMVQ